MTAKRIAFFSRRTLVAGAFLAPVFLLLILFRFYPIGSAIFHSFTRWDGYTAGSFVGLDNYARLVGDSNMIASARNIGWFVVGRLFLNLTFPMLGAMLIFHLRNRRAGYVYRVAFMVPMVVPLLVVLLVWRFIYHPHDGILNQILGSIGLSSLQRIWLADFDTALGSVIAMGFPWVTGLGIAGFGVLIYLAGLQSIPTDVFDALTVDGCRTPARVFRIELPLIANQIKLVAALTIINTLQSYVPVMILTGGGPSNASLVPGLYLYRMAFNYDRFGYASAIGVLMAVVLVVMTMITNRYIRTRTE